MRHSGTPGLALLAVLGVLSACSGGLYTAEGLPPLNGGGGNTCGADQVECVVNAVSTCVTESRTNCGTCGNDCTAGAPIANGVHECVAHACSFTCNPGFLRGAGGCERATFVSAGLAHTCAISFTGRLECWGDNTSGQATGTAGAQPITVPQQVRSGGVAAVAAGAGHTCAVVNGAVECWGSGAGATPPTPPLGAVLRLSAGADHTCALHGGTVTCWGNPASILTPPTLGTVIGISSGSNHACAFDTVGTITCWGDAARGQLGSGPQVGIAVGAGYDHVCYSPGNNARTLVCWGDGTPTPAAHPKVNFDSELVASGRSHTCMKKIGATEGVRCIGDNSLGQLGQDGVLPGEVSTVSGVVGNFEGLAAGADHTCAIFPVTALSEQTLQCWGSNARGQLGIGSTITPAIFGPQPVHSR